MNFPSQSCFRLVAYIIVALVALGTSDPFAVEAKKLGEEVNPLAPDLGRNTLQTEIRDRQYLIDETVFLDIDHDASIGGGLEFKSFTDSAKRAFRPYEWPNINGILSKEKPRFYASTSADGKYAFLASIDAVFTTYSENSDTRALETTTSKHGGRYLIFAVPDRAWSLGEMLTKVEPYIQRYAPAPGEAKQQWFSPDKEYEESKVDPAHFMKYLQKSLAADTIFGEQILNIQRPPSELLAKDEVRVQYIDPPPSSYTAHKISTKKPPPLWYARLSGCCFYGARPPDLTSFDTLAKAQFNQRKVHLVNFLANTFAQSTIEKLAQISGRNGTSSPVSFKTDTAHKLENIFSKSQGEVVLIAGHVEGEKRDTFVAYDASAVEMFRVGINELQKLADKYHVSLILLGCTTYSTVRSDAKNIVGTVDDISTRRAIEQLDKALTTATNWGEFFERLAAPDMVMVASNRMANFNDKKHFSLTADMLQSRSQKQSIHIFEFVGFLRAKFQCNFLDSKGEC